MKVTKPNVKMMSNVQVNDIYRYREGDDDKPSLANRYIILGLPDSVSAGIGRWLNDSTETKYDEATILSSPWVLVKRGHRTVCKVCLAIDMIR